MESEEELLSLEFNNGEVYLLFSKSFWTNSEKDKAIAESIIDEVNLQVKLLKLLTKSVMVRHCPQIRELIDVECERSSLVFPAELVGREELDVEAGALIYRFSSRYHGHLD